MLTVLQIAQAAMDELGLPVPSSIISTTDSAQRQIKALLISAARDLRKRRRFPQLKKQATVTLENARSKYPLVSDYFAALPETKWDDDRQRRLIGPLSDAAFTENTKGLLPNASLISYRIFGPDLNPSSNAGQLEIYPTPTADGGTLSYEYITRNLFVASDYTTFSETIAADSDYCLFDDDLMVAELKWRYLRAKKKDYSQEISDAKDLLEGAVSRWNGTKIGSMAGVRRQRRYGPTTSGGWSF